MAFEFQLISSALRALSQLPPGERLAGLCALAVIAHLWHRTRCLTEALRLERERRLSDRRAYSMRLSETVKSLIELWSKAPAPRLKDIANNIEDDFELKS